MTETGIHRIALGGEWSLQDLYEYPHTYGKGYSFFFNLTQLRDSEDDLIDELLLPFRINAWRGGYDAVNFYKQLASRVPRAGRPRLYRVQYASPGFLDLSLVVPVAIAVNLAVKAFNARSSELISNYRNIQQELRDRKLHSLDVRKRELELRKDELQFLDASADSLGEMLDLPEVSLVREATGNNSLTTLKVVLAHYRRVRTLANYAKSGQAKP